MCSFDRRFTVGYTSELEWCGEPAIGPAHGYLSSDVKGKRVRGDTQAAVT